ncbi:hypothetical protein KOR42_18720 [Thalassoglobus neptunius]|uniref:SxtJ n=1 Tax=Thalassoglobus neptunius TaxID=1938619 RepID=A0A5C5X5V5_9PLAN|nr:SxtJ family membrane protein [Thalassoglobus neptunius]TWT58497.1 hypothetical protein KOR42_18720 [Thalassoglobus neptunius]
MTFKDLLKEPTSKDLRFFAGLQFPFFLFISWLLHRRGIEWGWLSVLLVISAIVMIVGLSKPRLVRWIYFGWMAAVFPIGWVVSHLIMAMVYYLVVTPVGMIRRRRHGDPLHREFDPEADSYWVERPGQKPDESYFRQF